MSFISTSDAAKKWELSVRQVQNLCDKGKIPGIQRFNRSWAIPVDAQRPSENARKPAQVQDTQIRSFLPSPEELHLFRFVAAFPYPIQVFAPNGILLQVNEAWKQRFQISDAAAAKMLGKYNILNDPTMEKWDVKDNVTRLFQGETVLGEDMLAPLKDISDTFGEGRVPGDTFYHNIISFAVRDHLGRIMYTVIMFITTRHYNGRPELQKAREYLENHWREKLDIDEAAKASSLSRGHFVKLFKTSFNMTPHEYHLSLKIKMLQKRLLNSGISVHQAFEECGMEYNSYYTGVFKAKVGMAPMQWRKSGSV